MIGLPFVGAFLEAAGMILEKKVLKSRYLNYKNYTTYEFLAIVVCMLPIVYFFWRVDVGALYTNNLIRFGIVIVVSVLANLFIFYSLKREDIGEFEPIWVMQPLFIVVLAFILYPAERNWIFVALALIASISLIATHIKKSHLNFNKYLIAAVIGSFLFALELVLSKPILHLYSPFTFYFIRSLGILVIVGLMYRPNFNGVRKNNWYWILIIGLMWVFYRAIIYYGYESIGIILTTLIFILSPVLMLIFANIFLKEKITLRQIIATTVIVACVAASALINT